MTIAEFISWLGQNPFYVIAYFLWVPFTALLLGWVAKGEGHLNPWRYVYAGLIYLVAIPGIFAIGLNVYLFLFERRSIFQTDLFTQVLPVLSLIGTILIVKRQVPLDYVPGFDRISGLLMIVAAAIFIMWIMDRMRLIAFSYIRFEYLLVIFAVIFVILRLGAKRVFR